MEEISYSLDERVQIIGKIFQSVGISAVVWGADALLHHAISTIKTVFLDPFAVDNNREMISFFLMRIF
jgi:hypothetical protein